MSDISYSLPRPHARARVCVCVCGGGGVLQIKDIAGWRASAASNRACKHNTKKNTTARGPQQPVNHCLTEEREKPGKLVNPNCVW